MQSSADKYQLNLAEIEINYLSSSIVSYSQEQVFRNETIRRSNVGFICGADINLKHMVLGARASWDFFRNTAANSTITPHYKNVCFLGTV